MLRVGQEGLVLLEEEGVLRRIYPGEVAQMPVLPAVSLDSILLDELIAFLLGLPGLLACERAFEEFSLLEVEGVVLDLVGDVDEDEGVLDECLLDERVEGSVGGEAGRVVHLQDHRLQAAVQDHVKS